MKKLKAASPDNILSEILIEVGLTAKEKLAIIQIYKFPFLNEQIFYQSNKRQPYVKAVNKRASDMLIVNANHEKCDREKQRIQYQIVMAFICYKKAFVLVETGALFNSEQMQN